MALPYVPNFIADLLNNSSESDRGLQILCQPVADIAVYLGNRETKALGIQMKLGLLGSRSLGDAIQQGQDRPNRSF